MGIAELVAIITAANILITTLLTYFINRKKMKSKDEKEDRDYWQRQQQELFNGVYKEIGRLERVQEQIEKERDEFFDELQQIKVEYAEIKAENAQIKAENAQIKTENAELRKENVYLRDRIEQLTK